MGVMNFQCCTTIFLSSFHINSNPPVISEFMPVSNKLNNTLENSWRCKSTLNKPANQPLTLPNSIIPFGVAFIGFSFQSPYLQETQIYSLVNYDVRKGPTCSLISFIISIHFRFLFRLPIFTDSTRRSI